jgi:hypothetical protein
MKNHSQGLYRMLYRSLLAWDVSIIAKSIYTMETEAQGELT